MLAAEDTDAVLSWANELTEICAARARFSDVGRNELTLAANDLAMYRFKSLETAKRSTRETRRFFPDDLRRADKKGYPDVSFRLEIFYHLPVDTHLDQPDGEVRFAEIDIPRALLTFSPPLSDIAECSDMINQCVIGFRERDR